MGNSSSSSSSNYGPPRPAPRPSEPRFHKANESFRSKSRYSVIDDNYGSLEQVQNALKQAGLESSNLILGIDFTKSNQWTGQHSFGGRSLHALGNEQNPYETALRIVGLTLAPFDEDNLIPCFGFGDSTTHDKQVFGFYPDQRPCGGFEEAHARYRAIVPHVRLAGPTSFAPIINAAVDIVEGSGGQYHVLVVIADGQIEKPQERATVDAIVNASQYALSIVLVGVGDGPWNLMRSFDDSLPSRVFDNFQFVNFTEIMQSNLPPHRKEAQFALAALMEIPLQYKATIDLQLLGRSRGSSPGAPPLPPPPMLLQMDGQAFGHSPSYGRPQAPPMAPTSTYIPPAAPNVYGQYGGYYPPPPLSALPLSTSRAPDEGVAECPVCLTEEKDMAFNCGHRTCRQCGTNLTHCPICRGAITSRVRLY